MITIMKFYHILLEWSKYNTLTEPNTKKYCICSHRTLIHCGENSATELLFIVV